MGVGLTSGVAGGALTGYGAGRAKRNAEALLANNPAARHAADAVLASAGFENPDTLKTLRGLNKKMLGIGTAVGAGLGAFKGAYQGMQTGVGLNDRQFLLQRNIESHEMVNNSAMASMNATTPGLNPLAPMMNQAFGAQVGSIRRSQFKNNTDGSLERKQ